MTISADLLRGHLEYTAWASGMLLDAARALSPEELNRDFGVADKSVLGTLVHIFAGDRIWLERMHGIKREALVDPSDHDFAKLQQAWPTVQQGWKDWAAGLTDTRAVEEVEFYRSATGGMFRMPAWQIVMHVVNHGTHHRGAVSGFLRAMGKTPPKLDLIAYYFARPSAISAAS
ncbi:MAG TPA: DinB family protein [Bryobacteraceae bacterium]|jgi:uncharacterized damage-inducible protein DinB|nr:DinB family protein [Bryobacteraceae bacterium]